MRNIQILLTVAKVKKKKKVWEKLKEKRGKTKLKKKSILAELFLFIFFLSLIYILNTFSDFIDVVQLVWEMIEEGARGDHVVRRVLYV